MCGYWAPRSSNREKPPASSEHSGECEREDSNAELQAMILFTTAKSLLRGLQLAELVSPGSGTEYSNLIRLDSV